MDAKYLPLKENKTDDTSTKCAFHYCDESGSPIFLTKEIYRNKKCIVLYPYTLNREDGSIKAKRINKLEFIGWDDITDIPDDFKTDGKYGIKKLRAKNFFNILYSKFKNVSYFTIGINVVNSFREDHITLNWADLKPILNDISREKNSYDRERVFLINRKLSTINQSIAPNRRYLSPGDLYKFLARFDSFDKINSDDLNAISTVLDLVPPSVINMTSNFIHSKEKINKVYIEDLIDKFEKLLLVKKDNEKQWQVFFEKNAWILSHLFPYEVILNQREAYVGGKTIANNDGRVVDFLFANGFEDNYALLEIKTHRKDLLKSRLYRAPAVFSISDELSGGIAQCLDQKDTFVKEFGKKIISFNPKCILIIGMKSVLTEKQKSCFELLRSNQESVDIVTFDEVLMKLKGLLKVLNY